MNSSTKSKLYLGKMLILEISAFLAIKQENNNYRCSWQLLLLLIIIIMLYQRKLFWFRQKHEIVNNKKFLEMKWVLEKILFAHQPMKWKESKCQTDD